MKKLLVSLLIVLAANILHAQYNDPNFPKPTSGYGSDGVHTVDVISIVNLNFPGHAIKIYHPQDISTPVPTIFYSHAYGGTDPDNIIGVLEFIAKKGYAVVFVPYPTTTDVTVEERYGQLIAGFRKAVELYPDILNTQKVGFLGHSFGGAASFGIAHECFTVDGWGENGRFIYALAQWYAYNLTPDNLNDFPENTKVLVEVFNDDTTNDHRMAIDIFNHISVSTEEKDFLLVPSSTVNGYTYSAIHNMPNTSAAFDALDYYAYYRFIDAISDYTFNENITGKDMALGNGSAAQLTMPEGMANLQQFENPHAVIDQSNYEFKCSDDLNPRIEYCESVMSIPSYEFSVQLFPNPISDFLFIEIQNSDKIKVVLYDTLGHETGIYKANENAIKIDLSHLAGGIYFAEINGKKEKIIKL
ncbi:T9SS type A sorting domain-containing protein [Flavobacterium sp. AG291]|uniref:T9SS type A sorting domain-containing protein n=1 Tax=Flavobacterium sp. AG291 TaxID=2184000 RepID=UPI000E2DDE5E|nr:T9SS type A sorting domain-containing protein [Flavobacterium sp. AG291]RDI14488.1 putative secreted protein (Por secretion system target) [Flavobacterium sp. AG291]